jgi:hypothetical protein
MVKTGQHVNAPWYVLPQVLVLDHEPVIFHCLRPVALERRHLIGPRGVPWAVVVIVTRGTVPHRFGVTAAAADTPSMRKSAKRCVHSRRHWAVADVPVGVLQAAQHSWLELLNRVIVR